MNIDSIKPLRHKLSLIVAVAENGVIGRDGDLPWRMSSDLKTFRRLTMGKPVIMGRKTFETLKKPLDGRLNIVITRAKDFKVEGVTVVGSVDAALEAAERSLDKLSKPEVQSGSNVPSSSEVPEVPEIIIMGGAEIYRQTLPLANRIYLTEVHASPDGDSRFPSLSKGRWREVSAIAIDQGPRDDYPATLRILERIEDSKGVSPATPC